MNNITYAVSVDVNNPIIPYNVYVANVLDSNVRYLEITLYQNGNVIALSNEATATASLVTDDVLIDDSVECTISDNIISVPLEDLQRHGNLDVQVTVTEGEKVLAIPFPIQVRVTPNIAEEAQIDENSMGSYAEVVQEIAEARGTYDSLKQRIDNSPSDERLETALDAYIQEHPFVKFVEPSSLDDCIEPDVLYRVVESDSYKTVLCVPNDTQRTQYMFDSAGLIVYRTATKTEGTWGTWGEWDYIPTHTRVTDLIGNSLNNYYTKTEVDNAIPTVPTNVSAFTNDAGYLTQHQDITGKEDKSNKINTVGSSTSGTQYPSIKCMTSYVNNAILVKESKSNKVTSMTAQSTDAQYPSAKAVYDALSTKANASSLPTKTSDLTNDSGFMPIVEVSSIDSCTEEKVLYRVKTGNYTSSCIFNVIHPAIWGQFKIDVNSGGVLYRAKLRATPDSPWGQFDDFIAFEDTFNKVTSITAQSTDDQYPTAKCVYDLIGDIETLLSQV